MGRDRAVWRPHGSRSILTRLRNPTMGDSGTESRTEPKAPRPSRLRGLFTGEWKPWGDHPFYAIITLIVSVYGVYLARSQLKAAGSPQVVLVQDSTRLTTRDCERAIGRWRWHAAAPNMPLVAIGSLELTARGDAEFTFNNETAVRGFGKWECREPNAKMRISWDGTMLVENHVIAPNGRELNGTQSPTGAMLRGTR